MAEVLGGLTGALQGTVNNVINQGQSLLDRFFPPETRNAMWAKFTQFATERPKLTAFLLSQFALSGIPLLLFFVMTVTVFVFALIAAILVGVLGALLFTVFCVGIALIVLLPTLFITTFAATFIFLWGVGAYYLIKWFNEKDIPGIHTGFVEGVKAKLYEGNESTESKSPNGQASQPKKLENGSAHENGGTHKETKEQKKEGIPKLPTKDVTDKVGDVGKSTGLDVGDVGDVKKKADLGNVSKTADVGNLKKSVPGGVL